MHKMTVQLLIDSLSEFLQMACKDRDILSMQ